MVTHSESWVGHELADGRYRIDALLGEGGMGFAYRARDRNLDTAVVVKVPRRAMLEDRDFAHRFGREVRALVQLVHPHIVKVTDAGEHEGLPYAVMQYLPGGSLEDRRVLLPDGRARPEPPASLDDWLPVIAKALDFVHSRQVVHRDVKPGNILFDEHGNAYLSDFGIVKALATAAGPGRAATMTSAGNVVGTPEYMALELVMGRPFDGRADQYALAVTAYELLAGRRPYEETGMALMVRLGQPEGPPALHRVCPGVPEGLSRAVHRGLEKDPAARYPSCAAFAAAVLAEARGVSTPRTGAGTTRKMAADPCPLASGHTILNCPSCRGRVLVPATVRGRRGNCSGCGARFRIADDLKSLQPLGETTSGSQSVILSTLGIDLGEPSPRDSEATKRGQTVRQTAGASVSASAPAVGGASPARVQRRRRPWLGASVAAGAFGLVALAAAFVPQPGKPGNDARSVASPDPGVVPGGAGATSPRPAIPAAIAEPVTLLDIPDQTIARGQTLTLTARPEPGRAPGRALRFRLLAGRRGAEIDASSGVFTWTPGPDQPLGSSQFVVQASDPAHPAQIDQESFSVDVRAVDPLLAATPPPARPHPARPPLAPALAFNPQTPGVIIAEDFRNVVAGERPKNWTAQFENVKKAGAILELTNPTHRDQLTLPPVALSEDFKIDLRFSLPSSSTSVGLDLMGGSKETLTVYVFRDGTIHWQAIRSKRLKLQREGAFRPGTENELRLERTGLKYRVALNGVVVDNLPVQIGKVKFQTIRLSLGPDRPSVSPSRREDGYLDSPADSDSSSDLSPGIHSIGVIQAPGRDEEITSRGRVQHLSSRGMPNPGGASRTEVDAP